MALIVEDGTGLENAESYESVNNADRYAAAFLRAEWAGQQVADKEGRLRLATTYVDNMWEYPGCPLLAVQELKFPRQRIWVDGVLVTGVPKQVKRAVLELATFPGLPSLTPPLDGERVVLSERKELDGLKKAITYADRPAYRHFVIAERLLAPLTGASLRSGIAFGRLRPC